MKTSQIKKDIESLDGVAAVNLEEPSPCDLLRVTEAYRKLRQIVKKQEMHLDIAMETLGRISQLENLPLDDSKTLIKKHNVMGMFASEALNKLNREGEL